MNPKKAHKKMKVHKKRKARKKQRLKGKQGHNARKARQTPGAQRHARHVIYLAHSEKMRKKRQIEKIRK